MANIISYIDCIELMQSIAERHYQLNSFFLGRDWELENNEDIQYPLFQVYPEVASMPINDWKQYKTLEITLNCKVIDLTTPAEENEKDVHSDTLRIAQDIVNELNAHPYYIHSNVSLIDTINFTAIEEFKDDITAGWKFQLKLRIINANTFCGMPIAELPGYSAAGPSSSGTYVITNYLTCETLSSCPIIIQIQEDIAGLTGATAIPSDLSSVLSVGNSTGGVPIISPDTNNSIEIFNSGINITAVSQINLISPANYVTGTFYQVATDNVNVLTQITSDIYSASLISINNNQNNQIYAIPGTGVGLYVSDALNSIASTLTIYSSTFSISDGSTDNTIVVDDALSNKGLVYAADYSANFTANSLVTKAYVDSLTPTPPSLSSVLTTGNVMNTGQLITAQDGKTYFTLDDGFYLEFSDNNSSSLYMYDTSLDIFHSNKINIDSPLTQYTRNIQVDGNIQSPDTNSYMSIYDNQVFFDSNNNTIEIDGTNDRVVIKSTSLQVTSDDNAQISIVSSVGFYYPNLSFYNNGGTSVGSITAYAGVLYTSPLNVNGVIDVNLNKIIQVATGSNPFDAVNYSQLSTLGSLYVPYIGATGNVDLGSNTISAKSHIVTGTAGSGYVEYLVQSATPSAPSSGFRIFSGTSSNLNWIKDNGYIVKLQSSNTADRTYTLQDSSDTFVMRNTTDTVTNKRITKRVVNVTSSATPTLNTNNCDIASLTGLATNITNASTNLTGTPNHGDLFSYEITDNGVSRTISWGSSFSASGTLGLPTTTVISTLLRCLFQWDSTLSKWVIVASV